MNNQVTSPTAPRRWSAGRVALVVTGAVTGLVAAGVLLVGGVALWGDAQKDEDGYLSTDSHRFTAETRALATEDLDIDLDGAESVVDTGDFGKVRLAVEPQTDKPVFVGVARTDDLSAYLRDVAHTTVTDIDSSPSWTDIDSSEFSASYSGHAGERSPAPPAKQGIWAASAHGAGPQTLDWDVEDGNWSVVVMNADGTPGVQADISAGAKLPFLDEVGWIAVGGGALLLVVAAGLVVAGARPPRNPSAPAPSGGLVPATG
jgi:hypothetical protein